MSTLTSTTKVAAANLRAAADILDAHPDVQQPYVVTSSDGTVRMNWYLNGRSVDQKAIAATVVSTIDGTWHRGESGHDGPLASWTQTRDGIELYVQVDRDQVCERVVTGTETVTVPAVMAQPERTEERELVEWRCTPLLADEQVSA